MKITSIPGMGDYGVFIDGVDFNTLDDETWMRIGELHLDKLVTIIRDSKLTWENQAPWMEKFGGLRENFAYHFTTKYNEKTFNGILERARAGDPSIEEKDRQDILTSGYIGKWTKDGKYHVGKITGKRDKDGNPLGLFAEGELLWHSNEGGQLSFTPGVTFLGASGVVGSATGFVTTAEYYQNISESFRSELDEMIIIHRFQEGVMNPGNTLKDQDLVIRANMCPVDDNKIPLVIQSPAGIKGMHYPINTVWKIDGMSKEESDKVFKRINDELFTDKYVYDHWYKNDGDLCMFDNSITLHRRLGSTDNRMGYRVQHDYTNLLDKPWQPYFQKEYQDKFIDEIKAVTQKLGYDDFKIPEKVA